MTQFFIKLLGTVDDLETEWTPRRFQHERKFFLSSSRKNRVMKLLKEIEIGDKFVLYCTTYGFMGLATATSTLYEDSRLDGPKWPYIIDVKPELLVDGFGEAIPIREVKQWTSLSPQLSYYLEMNLHGGLFQITEADFQRFKQELQRKRILPESTLSEFQ